MLFKVYSILIRFRYVWLALSVLSALGGVYFYGYYKGKAAAENAVMAANIQIMEKRNAIANNRPDDSATIKRLRSGSF